MEYISRSFQGQRFIRIDIPAAPTYGVYISQFLGLVVPITFQQHLHMEYISLSFQGQWFRRFDIPAAPTYGVYISQFLELVVLITFQQHLYMEYISIGFQSQWFLRFDIPGAPTYGVNISQFLGLVVPKVQHSSSTYIWSIYLSSGSYKDFLDSWQLLTRKLLDQWFLLVKLK